jgi:SAM-dependent methyltransferase
MARTQCPACLAGELTIFHTVRDVPTNSCILLSTEEEARACQRGDIELGYCATCGFVCNAALEPEKTEYSGRYEETQAYSATFNDFQRDLVDELIQKHDLRDKHVFEIGCGKGEFLALFAEMGGNRATGVDPGVDPSRFTPELRQRLTLIDRFFDPSQIAEPVDFLACKMTLEHIPEPLGFMDTVAHGLQGQDTTLFLQVPEASRIFETCAFEDIYYEHCNYFSPGALAHLVARAGFEPLDAAITYGGQYLTQEARAGAASAVPVAADTRLGDAIASFPTRLAERLDQWRDQIDGWQREGRKIALWGSGSKAVSFLSTLDAGDAIAMAIDINPRRRGHFMPGSGNRIVAPDDLPQEQPDVVIIMNPIYRGEIERELQRHGLTPEIATL